MHLRVLASEPAVSSRDHQSGNQPDMTMAWEDSISETLDEAEEALKAAAKAF
jgi:hypothetical protein